LNASSPCSVGSDRVFTFSIPDDALPVLETRTTSGGSIGLKIGGDALYSTLGLLTELPNDAVSWKRWNQKTYWYYHHYHHQ